MTSNLQTVMVHWYKIQLFAQNGMMKAKRWSYNEIPKQTQPHIKSEHIANPIDLWQFSMDITGSSPNVTILFSQIILLWGWSYRQKLGKWTSHYRRLLNLDGIRMEIAQTTRHQSLGMYTLSWSEIIIRESVKGKPSRETVRLHCKSWIRILGVTAGSVLVVSACFRSGRLVLHVHVCEDQPLAWKNASNWMKGPCGICTSEDQLLTWSCGTWCPRHNLAPGDILCTSFQRQNMTAGPIWALPW